MNWRKFWDCGQEIWYSPCNDYSIAKEGTKAFSVRVSSGSIARLSLCKEVHVATCLRDAKEFAVKHKKTYIP